MDSHQVAIQEKVIVGGTHLKAETFEIMSIPLDGLSQSVQSYISTVVDAFGCPRDYATVICLHTAGVAAGKMVIRLAGSYYGIRPYRAGCSS